MPRLVSGHKILKIAPKLIVESSNTKHGTVNDVSGRYFNNTSIILQAVPKTDYIFKN